MCVCLYSARIYGKIIIYEDLQLLFIHQSKSEI